MAFEIITAGSTLDALTSYTAEVGQFPWKYKSASGSQCIS